MEYFFREPTEETPKVLLDMQKGILEMEGRCIPENAQEFFGPIHELLNVNLIRSGIRFKVHLVLEYFSTSSSKHILGMLRLLEKKTQMHGLDVVVEWHYKEGDDDLRESGEDYATLTQLPFVLKAI